MDTPVSGAPRLLLRLEGFAALIAGVIGYRELDASWALFAILFLLPDIAFAAYAAGPRVGAMVYNAFHTYLAPAVLAAMAYFTELSNAWPVCLIWIAHIGMDRSLGLGLKFASGFRETHLGLVGGVAPMATRDG